MPTFRLRVVRRGAENGGDAVEGFEQAGAGGGEVEAKVGGAGGFAVNRAGGEFHARLPFKASREGGGAGGGGGGGGGVDPRQIGRFEGGEAERGEAFAQERRKGEKVAVEVAEEGVEPGRAFAPGGFGGGKAQRAGFGRAARFPLPPDAPSARRSLATGTPANQWHPMNSTL